MDSQGNYIICLCKLSFNVYFPFTICSEELDNAIEFARSSGGILRLRVEDLSSAKRAESTSTVSSVEDHHASRLMSKKIWKNEKKLKKERKRYYAALAEGVGESRKESTNSDEQQAPVWFNTAMEKVIFISFNS